MYVYNRITQVEDNVREKAARFSLVGIKGFHINNQVDQRFRAGNFTRDKMFLFYLLLWTI